MDDLRAEMLAAAQASGIVETPEDESTPADADPTAAAESEASLDAAPEDDASPDEDAGEDTDDDSLAASDEDDEEPEVADPSAEELRAELEELRAERAAAAQRESERLAEQQRAEAERNQAEWAQAERNLEGWLRQSLGVLQNNRLGDEQLIAQSEDPNRLRAHLQQVRQQEENWVFANYTSQRQVFDDQRNAALRAAFAHSQIRDYAELTAQNFGLPRAAAEQLMRYADGTPVHPDAMPARAAELAERRNETKQLKRQLTQAQRSAKARELAGASVGPGSGGGAAPPKFESWRDELAWAATASGLAPTPR